MRNIFRVFFNLLIMIKISKIFKRSFLLVYLLLPFALAGCEKDQRDQTTDLGFSEEVENIEERDNVTNKKTVNDGSVITENNNLEDETTITEKEKNNLAGTCLKGDHCSAPGKCGLFIDRNNNELCDRGE